MGECKLLHQAKLELYSATGYARGYLLTLVCLMLASTFGGLTQTAQAASPPSPPTAQSPGSSSGPGTVVSGLTPTLSWSAATGATYYSLAISIYPYGTSNIIYSATNIQVTSHQVTSGYLTAGQKYRWNMRAWNSTGSSDYSNTLYFQTAVANVTLTLYVHENSASGPVIAGAQVTGQDGAGASFSQATNSSGYVT